MPNIGEVCLHDNRLVYITGGQYEGQSGGVSNHWNYLRIKSDGTLSKNGGSDYGHSFASLSPEQKVKKTITFKIPKSLRKFCRKPKPAKARSK